MNEVGAGEGIRSGCGSSEKGVASQTAGGVPGDDGLGILQFATDGYQLYCFTVEDLACVTTHGTMGALA